jgi:REP element-mobilizing transposase RayT
MLPQRKHPRLKKYDYSTPGAYFITICTDKRKCVFGTVLYNKSANVCNEDSRAGACSRREDLHQDRSCTEITTELTKYGKIAREGLQEIETRFENACVPYIVVMPNHIHMILEIRRGAAGASPRPTVEDIICAYKSIVTLKCKREGYEGKLFQSSFYEHIIRNEKDYEETVKYITENPIKWIYDELYCE